MNEQIGAGDTVEVTRTVKGFFRNRYLAILLTLTSSGDIRVKSLETGIVQVVRSGIVKKVVYKTSQ